MQFKTFWGTIFFFFWSEINEKLISTVKVTFQFFTSFGIETSKPDPRNGFLIDFWPKKKKNCTPKCLQLPKLSSKKEFLQLLILFFKSENLVRNNIILLFCSGPNQTRPFYKGQQLSAVYIVKFAIVNHDHVIC